MTKSSFQLVVPGTTVLGSSVSVLGPATFQLVSTVVAGGCASGDAGQYGWSLSPSGSTLTLTLIADTCANRATALPGAWSGIRCRTTGDMCLGDIDPGTYTRAPYAELPTAAQTVQSYTVPDGWANVEEYPADFILQRGTDYAKEAVDSSGNIDFSRPLVYVAPDPVPEDIDAACKTFVPKGARGTSDALIAWVTSRPGIVASAATSTTIAGHPATMVDVQVKAGWKDRCPAVGYLPLVATDWSGDWGEGDHERTRLIFVDRGATVVLIAIDAPTGSGFDAFVAQATPIVQSFTLAP